MRGRCLADTATCECFEGFDGPDCSLYTCPKGPAWVDTAVGFDKAHQETVCSNMGHCNQYYGICTCNKGFEGSACERMSCPNDCSTRGRCLSMNYYAQTKNSGEGEVFLYKSRWDAYRIFGCKCDTGYEGIDCSLRKCPSGDDPMTGSGASTVTNPNQFNEIQRITCNAAGGSFTLSFREQTTRAIPYDASSLILQTFLESLSTIGNVKVSLYGIQACMESGSSFTVEFLQEFGNVPMLVGDSKKLFYSDSQRTARILISEQQAGTKEDAYCSGRGLCDFGAGYCGCSAGFTTSNGYNRIGTRGDCGYAMSNIQTCPGLIACSGHGQCLGNPTYKCKCSDGWTGSDCGEQLCPKDIAWFALPTADNTGNLLLIYI